MIRQSLFGKHVIVTAGIFLVFIAIAVAASIIGAQLDHQRMESSPPVFLARLIDKMGPDKVATIKALNDSHEGPPIQLDLVDENGVSLLTSQQTMPSEQKSKFPKDVYRDSNDNGPRAFPPKQTLIRLKGMPIRYLVANFNPDLHRPLIPSQGGGPNGPPGPPMSMWVSLIALIAAVFLASGVSIFILFYSFRDKARIANQVISELQSGNLRARFPIRKLDEVGQVMLAFNKMADEIEHLVDNMKNSEQSRMQLLQELAHDLRTPVASLKNLLETVHIQKATIQPALRDDLMQLSLIEVAYFERLVEDLLFLAQVSEPRYKAHSTSLSLAGLLDEQIAIVATIYANNDKKIEIQCAIGDITVLGDAHLLKRLFRNALENAFSFARGHISVSAKLNKKKEVEIHIIDDGPGLSAEASRSFGVKRSTRILESASEGRVSVGLGSVLMVAVVNVHGGKLSITNDPILKGADLTIHLPTQAVG
jgi:signal transduction histidine kinase